MTRPRAALGLALGAFILAACAANRELVVVLPERDGHVGAVVVQAGAARVVLNQAYSAAAPGPRSAHPLPAGTLDGQKVDQLFGEALAAMPAPPLSQDLFFESDSLDLTAESAAALQALLETLKTRRAVEIVLTGHTDTMGADDYNDGLSKQRAESIKQALLPALAKYGVSAENVSAVGRGKRDLLIPTPDQTPEPRNRRVEITVK